jgi:hypothetical protein
VADLVEPLDLVAAPADDVDVHPTACAPVAILGVSGGLSGALVLTVPWELLHATHPDRSASVVDLADWAGELANVLAGRIKTRLGDLGATMRLSLPQIVIAPYVRGPRVSEGEVARFTCRGSAAAPSTIAVLFDATPMESIDSAIRSHVPPTGLFIDLS